jgi:NADH dehydrogenase FAD-containing subunit
MQLLKRSSEVRGDGGVKGRCSSSYLLFRPELLSLSQKQSKNRHVKMTVPEEVDIIIVGGGSAGCVPAGRLANLDHNLQVLVIEGGEDNLNNPW